MLIRLRATSLALGKISATMSHFNPFMNMLLADAYSACPYWMAILVFDNYHVRAPVDAGMSLLDDHR